MITIEVTLQMVLNNQDELGYFTHNAKVPLPRHAIFLLFSYSSSFSSFSLLFFSFLLRNSVLLIIIVKTTTATLTGPCSSLAKLHNGLRLLSFPSLYMTPFFLLLFFTLPSPLPIPQLFPHLFISEKSIGYPWPSFAGG